MSLLECFNNAKSDKGKKHNYHLVYEPILEEVRNLPLNFLEVGTFRGASIVAWLDYFPNANIYTMDIFERVKAEDIEVLKDDRVHWMKINSTGKDVTEQVKKEWGDVEFDFIIDDGSHLLKDQRDTFSNLYPLLKSQGTYWIEDIFEMSKVTFMECGTRYRGWWQKNSCWFSDTEWNKFMNNFTNFKYEHILAKDNRKTNDVDSCIYEIKKP